MARWKRRSPSAQDREGSDVPKDLVCRKRSNSDVSTQTSQPNGPGPNDSTLHLAAYVQQANMIFGVRAPPGLHSQMALEMICVPVQSTTKGVEMMNLVPLSPIGALADSKDTDSASSQKLVTTCHTSSNVGVSANGIDSDQVLFGLDQIPVCSSPHRQTDSIIIIIRAH